jgi:hypothetical protein
MGEEAAGRRRDDGGTVLYMRDEGIEKTLEEEKGAGGVVGGEGIWLEFSGEAVFEGGR